MCWSRRLGHETMKVLTIQGHCSRFLCALYNDTRAGKLLVGETLSDNVNSQDHVRTCEVKKE